MSKREPIDILNGTRVRQTKLKKQKKTVEATCEPWHLCEPVQCANIANGTNTEAESPLDVRP